MRRLRAARKPPVPLERLSIRALIIRIRWERAKREVLPRGSPAESTLGAYEANLIRELHRRFGVDNITAADLEWYLRADRKGMHRRARGEESA